MESHVHSDRDCDKVTSVCFSWCHQHILDTGHVGGASVPVHRAMRLGIPIRDKATRGRKKISPYDPRSLPSLGRIRAPRMRRLVFFFLVLFPGFRWNDTIRVRDWVRKAGGYLRLVSSVSISTDATTSLRDLKPRAR